jgi:hypothetical protein
MEIMLVSVTWDSYGHRLLATETAPKLSTQMELLSVLLLVNVMLDLHGINLSLFASQQLSIARRC